MNQLNQQPPRKPEMPKLTNPQPQIQPGNKQQGLSGIYNPPDYPPYYSKPLSSLAER